MKNCAFCGVEIDPNDFNACDECYEIAITEPESFIASVLQVEMD